MSHQCDPDCPHIREDQLDHGTSLFQYIDLTHVTSYNTDARTCAQNVIKPWSERLNHDPFVKSCDRDSDMILFIPFVSTVVVKSIVVVAGSEETCPRNVSLFVNRQDLDFSNVHEIVPTQQFGLNYDASASYEYTTRLNKFQNVSSLSLFFYGAAAEFSRLNYIGIKGESLGFKRQAVIAVYESRPAIHKTDSTTVQSLATQ